MVQGEEGAKPRAENPVGPGQRPASEPSLAAAEGHATPSTNDTAVDAPTTGELLPTEASAERSGETTPSDPYPWLSTASPVEGASPVPPPEDPPRARPEHTVSPPDPVRQDRRDTGAPSAPSSSLKLITGLLAFAVLILLGALAYLFSQAPGQNRIDSVDGRVGALTDRVAGLEKSGGDAAQRLQQVETLQARVAAAEQQLAALKTAVAAGGGKEAQPAPGAAEADAALQAKLADLQRELDEVKSAADQAATQRGDTEQKLGALQTKVDAIPIVNMAPVTARLDAVETRVKPIEAEFQAAKTGERVTDARQNGSAAETRAAPLAVTAQAVVRAIEAGRPFAQDAKVLETLGADPRRLQSLQAVAADGAPTLKDLRAELAALKDRMVATGTPAPSGSYLDRLLAGANTLVQVRPLGSVVGDSPAAVVSRMDVDLAADDLTASLSEWQKLPEPSRTTSRSLADRIKLRLAAIDAAHSIAADAIGAMAASQQ